MTAVEMARGLDSLQLKDTFGRTGPGLRRLLAEHSSIDLVLIMAGTNDVAMPQSSAQEVVSSLQSLHMACHAAGTPSMILSVPESCVTGTSLYPQAKAKWHAINKALAAWAEDSQSPALVDTSKLIPFHRKSCAEGLWDPDNLHFTAVGSKELGSSLAPALMEFLSLKVAHPKPIARLRWPMTPEKKSVKVVIPDWAKVVVPDWATDMNHVINDGHIDVRARCGAQSLSRVSMSKVDLFVPHIPRSLSPSPPSSPPAPFSAPVSVMVGGA